MIVETETFWGLPVTAWTAVYALLTAGLLVVAVLAALYAKRQWESTREQVKEMRKAELEARRPYIIVTAERSGASPQLFDLVVKNIGRRPAESVSITLTPPPVRAQETPGHELSNVKILTEPVAMIAPDQEMRVFYDSHIDRKGRDDLPAFHSVSLEYQDSSGHRYDETSVVDIDAMRGAMFTDVKTIHDIGKALSDIRQTLRQASVLKRRGGLEVEAAVEPRSERQNRRAEQQAMDKQNHEQLLRKLQPDRTDANKASESD